MLESETKKILQFLKHLQSVHIAEYFLYVIKQAYKYLAENQLENKLQLSLTETNAKLFVGSIEVLQVRTSQRGIIFFDLIRQADGRLFSYAGAAATPEGYNRLSINISETSITNALLQEWISGVYHLAQKATENSPSSSLLHLIKIIKDLKLKKQFLAYLRQDSTYKDLIIELLPNILSQSSFQKISTAQDFIFQKAIQAYHDFIALPIPEQLSKEFLLSFENFKGRYDDFVETIQNNPTLKKIANQLGQLISYVDSKATAKQRWNEYEDKRTIAWSVARQNHWITQLMQFHQNQSTEALSPNLKNVISYLKAPQNRIPVLSEQHRKIIVEEIIQQNYQAELFDQKVIHFFSSFKIEAKHPCNYNYLISSILYHPDIAEIWRKKNGYSIQGDLTELDHLEEAEINYNLFPSREENPLNQILFGPPGTGKTYLSIRMALSIVEGLPLDDILSQTNDYIQNRLDYYTQEQQIILVSFHPSMSYEDFVEGIKPTQLNNELSYKIEDGIFKRLAKLAQLKPAKPFVLIIDEINRGPLSAIFGELITLIEMDKRLGASNTLHTVLPYSKESFSIPSNLYLIGSMNTVDRGVEALDLALRRRFHFKYIPPQVNLLNNNLMGINLSKLLATINCRIQKLLGKQQAIGHAYLLNINNLQQLNQAFEFRIIPLLQEYFYNDLSKIGLVLGRAFVATIKQNCEFADFPLNNHTLHASPLYQIKSFPHKVESFISIYN